MPYTTPIFGFTAPLEDELAYLMPGTLQATVNRLETVLKDRAANPDLSTLNAVVARLAALEPTAWVNLPLSGGATAQPASYPAPKYRRIGQGTGARVEFAGLAYNPPANGTQFGLLPAGFRPSGPNGVVMSSIADDDAFNIYVGSGGNLYTQSRTGGFISLEGLSFVI